MTGRLLVDLTPLRRDPGYRHLWTGQILGQFGRQGATLALWYHVFTLTDLPLAIGGLGAVTLAALLLLALPGGAMADALDRRRVLLLCQVGQVAVNLGLAGLAVTQGPTLPLIYVLAFANAAIVAFDRPARRAAVSQLVPETRLASALVLDQGSLQLAKVAGPALAGVLIAGFDLVTVYLLGAGAFGIAALTVTRLPRMVPKLLELARMASIRDGLRFLRREPMILSTFALDLCAMVFALPIALFPLLALEVFGGGPQVLGLLLAAPAVGAIGGVLLSGWVSRVRAQGRAVLIAVVAWGIAIIGFGLSFAWLPLALAWLVVAGAADVLSAVFRNTIVQEAAPDSMRGRMTGVQNSSSRAVRVSATSR